MKVLQREADRTVVLEEGGLTVRKTFHGEDLAFRSRSAAYEFERMQRFSTALTDVEGATCPSPIELGSGLEPYIRMERAAGIPMQQYLGANSLRPADYEGLAAVLHIALLRYVETFGEPYWDFIFRNMFYDPHGRVVTFLDFGFPALYLSARDQLQRRSPIEVSVGSLLASSIFEAARPKRMWRRREHSQAFTLAGAVFERFMVTHGGRAVTPAGVRSVVSLAYHLAASGGSRKRRLWYRYLGSVLAQPRAKLDRVCPPLPLIQ